MMSEYEIVHVSKITCQKCGQEIPVYLFALPEHRPIKDGLRREVETRGRLYHQGECKAGGEWCPQVLATTLPWVEACGLEKILPDDGKHHRCRKTPGHDDRVHSCPCGREW